MTHQISYAEADNNLKIRCRKLRLSVSKSMGYNTMTEALLDLYNEQWISIVKIAERYQMSHVSIRKLIAKLRVMGFEMRKTPHKKTIPYIAPGMVFCLGYGHRGKTCGRQVEDGSKFCTICKLKMMSKNLHVKSEWVAS